MPQSVDRALDVLDAVAAADGPVPAKALARRLGCGLSTVYELLGTLTERGHLVRTSSGYLLGYRVPSLHHAFQRQMRMTDEVQELLLEGRRAAGVDTYFSTYRDGGIAVLAASAQAHPATGGFTVGRDTTPHATAHGKVLLAALPRAVRLRHLAASGMRAVTPRTITSPERLDAQLHTVRREGVAVEVEECAPGVACIAVPVPAPGAPTAVSAALPLEEFHRRGRQVTEAIRQVAERAAKFRGTHDITRATGG
ncbi:IclR family transcriptional regulator [Streptomyces sp. NPDC053048]|uniref:IclR family transcriptional regulator n=1 Tax=Streptomyces sp. NPDC053048 TaxID=3365694 RepID=UPI0037D57674